MGIRVHAVTVDCTDAESLARFWAEALGGQVRPTGNGYIAVEQVPGLDGWLLFQQVPEPRAGKNRLHLDLTADDVPRQIERLVALGATLVEERSDDQYRWWVFSDPEGNLFCLG